MPGTKSFPVYNSHPLYLTSTSFSICLYCILLPSPYQMAGLRPGPQPIPEADQASGQNTAHTSAPRFPPCLSWTTSVAWLASSRPACRRKRRSPSDTPSPKTRQSNCLYAEPGQ